MLSLCGATALDQVEKERIAMLELVRSSSMVPRFEEGRQCN